MNKYNGLLSSVAHKYHMSTALGHTINDTVRLKVRPKRGGYGLVLSAAGLV